MSAAVAAMRTSGCWSYIGTCFFRRSCTNGNNTTAAHAATVAESRCSVYNALRAAECLDRVSLTLYRRMSLIAKLSYSPGACRCSCGVDACVGTGITSFAGDPSIPMIGVAIGSLDAMSSLMSLMVVLMRCLYALCARLFCARLWRAQTTHGLFDGCGQQRRTSMDNVTLVTFHCRDRTPSSRYTKVTRTTHTYDSNGARCESRPDRVAVRPRRDVTLKTGEKKN